MPTALTESPFQSAPLVPPRKIWTRSECAVLEASGLLDGQHFELVDGELISKIGKHRPHVNSLTLLVGWLFQVFGIQFVNSEAPIDVAPEDNPTNEPQPDIIVLKRHLSQFKSANPRPEDLHLVVEIADTMINFDLTTKAALYARAWVVEYWVLDVAGRRAPQRAETLPPSSRRLFRLLEIHDQIDSAGFFETAGNTAWWGADEAHVEEYPDADGSGYQVTRDAFDRLLLDMARERGAVI